MKNILLVTGGSRGIGAAIAVQGAKKGFIVCFNYWKSREEAIALVDEINRQGGKAHAYQCNVADEAQVQQLFETIDREIGTITALVNNAGILEPRARLEEMSLDRWQRIFDVNLFGTFLCTKEAIKRMANRYGGKGGAIVNVSSAAARMGGAFEFIDYAATKGAMDTMTIGLAKELATEGVRVNAVRPGLIYTDIHADSGVPDRLERLIHKVPMKRGGTPEEVAEVILWLLSDESSYVTGTLVDVSGGR